MCVCLHVCMHVCVLHLCHDVSVWFVQFQKTLYSVYIYMYIYIYIYIEREIDNI